jgi:hypothetical protein
MKGIGGFLAWEQPTGTQGAYHIDALGLTSGRACLASILDVEQPKRVYLPFFCCDSLLLPLEERGIPWTFYPVDEALTPCLDALDPQPDEWVLVIHYFGLQRALMDELFRRYGSRLIVDNTQAFFETTPQRGWWFNSARKFFGVPDGAYLHGPASLEPPAGVNRVISCEHLLLRKEGRQEEAYAAFLQHEAKISTRVLRMSPLSAALLARLDYSQIQARRRDNFLRYHQALESMNTFPVVLEAGAVPFCYPLVLPHPIDRQVLFDQQVFVPTLWKEILARPDTGYTLERELCQRLLPLPVDHRYGPQEVDTVIQAVDTVIQAVQTLARQKTVRS